MVLEFSLGNKNGILESVSAESGVANEVGLGLGLLPKSGLNR